MNNSAPDVRTMPASDYNQTRIRRSSAGFTLVELLMSIAVLGVLAAISLPQLNGIYERQKLTNSAHELVSQIKTLQNKALANNQDRFAVPRDQGGPITDCTDSRPYVDGYRFIVNPSGNGTSYSTNFVFKQTSKEGTACDTDDPKMSTIILPPGVTFSASDLGDTITYETVTGKLTLYPNSGGNTAGQLRLTSQRIDPSILTYYICTNQGRVYAQTEEC